MSAPPDSQNHQVQDNISNVEEVSAQVAFSMCSSQAYEGSIDFWSKEGKRLYALATSVKLLDDPVNCNANE